MSETLSAIVKTGGDFITRAASGSVIGSGVTGVLRIITPPTGQRVRLTHLSTTAGANQTGISINIGAETVIDQLDLDGDSPTATVKFSVGNYQPYAAGNPPASNYKQFTGGKNEDVVISKNAGNTTTSIYYGYEFGL